MTENHVAAAVQASIDPAYHRVIASRRSQPTQAAQDVLAERQRQIDKEGWTPEHDDAHGGGEMSAAAGIYALHSGGYDMQHVSGDPSAFWPWDKSWWKPSADPRRSLVKAAALLLAEIERIDRAASAQAVQL